MQVGISVSSTSSGAAGEGAAAMVERAAAAHRVGLASLSVGDNHVAKSVNYYQNTPMLGRLLAEWTDRPAGCLFLLPLWSPMIVAEHIATLAAIHDGPFIVQTGVGQSYDQYGGLRSAPAGRGAVADEAIGVIKALLAGDSVSSELFGLDGVSMRLRPEVELDWWIGAGAAAGVDRAARSGDAWYAGPWPTAAELVEPVDHYRDACAALDRIPRVMVRRDVLLLADAAAAETHAETLIAGGYRGLDRSRVVVGDPDSVVEQLAPLADLGVEQIVMRCMHVPQPVALETIEMMGDVNRRLSQLN